MPRRSAALVGALVLAAPGHARAQLHADASASVGAEARVLGSTKEGASVDDPGRAPLVGPTVGLKMHAALLPLLRVGPATYAALSPRGDAPPRALVGLGLEARIFSPFFVASRLRPWIGVGFGTAAARAPGYTTRDGRAVSSAGGGFFEIPLALGASYRLRKPWFATFELGLRWAFGHHGSIYEEGRRVVTPGPLPPGASGPTQLAPAGLDRLGLGASLGVGVEL